MSNTSNPERPRITKKRQSKKRAAVDEVPNLPELHLQRRWLLNQAAKLEDAKGEPQSEATKQELEAARRRFESAAQELMELAKHMRKWRVEKVSE